MYQQINKHRAHAAQELRDYVKRVQALHSASGHVTLDCVQFDPPADCDTWVAMIPGKLR